MGCERAPHPTACCVRLACVVCGFECDDVDDDHATETGQDVQGSCGGQVHERAGVRNDDGGSGAGFARRR